MKTARFRIIIENEIQRLLEKMSRDPFPDTVSGRERIADVNDQATAIVEKDLELLLHDRDRLRLNLLRDAIKRIEGGTFGICAECSEPIPDKRLELNPAAENCMQCQDRMEKSMGRRSRMF
jgi:DnaK suppressor protein